MKTASVQIKHRDVPVSYGMADRHIGPLKIRPAAFELVVRGRTIAAPPCFTPVTTLSLAGFQLFISNQRDGSAARAVRGLRRNCPDTLRT